MLRRLASGSGVVTTVRALLAFVVLLIVAMPLWELLGLDDAARSAFAPYCHQRFDRSFEWGGAVLPVCARCTGLWVGALLAALVLPAVVSPRRVPALRVLLWAAAPMAIDVTLEQVFGLPPRAWSRALSGLCAGAAVVSFVLPALVRAGEEIQARCATRSSTSQAW